MPEQLLKEKVYLNNNFLDRFKGRANKISKLGINDILLKGSQAQQNHHYPHFKYQQPIPTPKKDSSKKSVILQPLASEQLLRSKSVEKFKTKTKHINPQLKRHPSQKLPSLGSSKELPLPKALQRRASLEETLEKKLLLHESDPIDRTTSKNGSKYSQWKYPNKLDQNALRFFQFTEGERTYRSSRKFHY